MAETEKCPECEEMQKIHKDYCIWCSNYKGVQVCESCGKVTNEEVCARCLEHKKEIADAFQKAKGE